MLPPDHDDASDASPIASVNLLFLYPPWLPLPVCAVRSDALVRVGILAGYAVSGGANVPCAAAVPSMLERAAELERDVDGVREEEERLLKLASSPKENSVEISDGHGHGPDVALRRRSSSCISSRLDAPTRGEGRAPGRWVGRILFRLRVGGSSDPPPRRDSLTAGALQVGGGVELELEPEPRVVVVLVQGLALTLRPRFSSSSSSTSSSSA